MSIEQLKNDLNQITNSCESTSEDSPSLKSWMVNNLLPWAAALTDEMEEMDGVLEEVVEQSEDVLHTESGQVFAGIIAGGLVIATELGQRAGNDQRVLKLIKEFRALAQKGTDLLEEIVIAESPAEDDDAEDDDGDEADGKAPSATGDA